jgi:hypothetical protein
MILKNDINTIYFRQMGSIKIFICFHMLHVLYGVFVCLSALQVLCI